MSDKKEDKATLQAETREKSVLDEAKEETSCLQDRQDG